MSDPFQPSGPEGPFTSPPSPPVKDEEAEALHPATEFILRVWQEYRVPVLGGLLALLAIAILTSWLGQVREQQQSEASVRLNLAASIFNQVSTNPGIPVADAEQLLTAAIDHCDRVREDHPGTPAAHRALFIKGRCHYERAFHYLGTDESSRALEFMGLAQSDFLEFIEESRTREDRAEGKIALAACLENRAFFTEDQEYMRSAISELREAVNLGEGTYLEAQALISQARCQEALGRFDEARVLYTRVSQMRPSLQATVGQGALSLTRQGGYADLAAERLERLESGIDIPEDS